MFRVSEFCKHLRSLERLPRERLNKSFRFSFAQTLLPRLFVCVAGRTFAAYVVPGEGSMIRWQNEVARLILEFCVATVRLRAQQKLRRLYFIFGLVKALNTRYFVVRALMHRGRVVPLTAFGVEAFRDRFLFARELKERERLLTLVVGLDRGEDLARDLLVPIYPPTTCVTQL